MILYRGSTNAIYINTLSHLLVTKSCIFSFLLATIRYIITFNIHHFVRKNMAKIFSKGDIKVTHINDKSRGKYIPPYEMREVLEIVNESSYVLYSVFRTFPFNESLQIEDAELAKILNWKPRKVRDNRLILEKKELLKIVRYGTKADGITQVIIGKDSVALFHAGLPSEIMRSDILNKIKRKLKITTSISLVNNINAVLKELQDNPSLYT